MAVCLLTGTGGRKRREIGQLDAVTAANGMNRASTQAGDLLSLHTYFVMFKFVQIKYEPDGLKRFKGVCAVTAGRTYRWGKIKPVTFKPVTRT